MELVAFVGDDKESWGQITGLINRGEWESVIVVKKKGVEGFPNLSRGEVIVMNTEMPLLDLKKEMMEKLKGKVKDFEVTLSLASGNGKEHMALISALLSIPVGIRLAVFTKEGVQFIN